MSHKATFSAFEKLLLGITNTLYLVPIQIRQFRAKNAQAEIVAFGASKARRFKADADIQYEVGWITARRSALILTTETLVCGTWTIPLANITHATLYRVKSYAMRALVLKVITPKEHYQFGLAYDPIWEHQTALPMQVENGKIEYSRFSVILRGAILMYLIWYILNQLF